MPWRPCLNPPASSYEVNIPAGMADFTPWARIPSTAICVGEVGGVEGEGGNAFFPFSLHEEDMPPKMEYTWLGPQLARFLRLR